MPACDARMVHKPLLLSVTVMPLIEQMLPVSEANETLKPDEAVALIGKGGVSIGLSASALKVIVCDEADVTVNARSTSRAAA